MVERHLILPEAQDEFVEAFSWYEEREPGLGEEFLRCVESCILSIRRNPEIYPIVCDQFRRALVRRFPYAIFYEKEGDTIVVYSIFHCSQNPEKWQKRLRKR